jgi:membrane-associated phospholipid phosphatase
VKWLWSVITILGMVSSLPGFESRVLERTGDYLQIGVPATAGIASLALRDWAGFRQFAAVMLVSQAATHLLKHTIQSSRPDGGRNGFPSAHTASAFAGSGFVAFRYGNRYAWPLHVAALVTGYSRITARKHGPVDVLGGAAVSLLSCWGLVRRRPRSADRGAGARSKD